MIVGEESLLIDSLIHKKTAQQLSTNNWERLEKVCRHLNDWLFNLWKEVPLYITYKNIFDIFQRNLC